MKWCRFQKSEKIAYGVIQGETVVEVVGSPFDGNGANDKAGVEQKRVAQHQLSDVKLLAPVIPPTFYAAGINYPDHVTWAAQMRGEEPKLPEKADIGYRAVNSLTGHQDPIIVPKTPPPKSSMKVNWWWSLARPAKMSPKARLWTTCLATPLETT